MSGAKWTDKDVKCLIDMIQSGSSKQECSAKLGRTYHAISKKIQYFGLTMRPRKGLKENKIKHFCLFCGAEFYAEKRGFCDGCKTNPNSEYNQVRGGYGEFSLSDSVARLRHELDLE